MCDWWSAWVAVSVWLVVYLSSCVSDQQVCTSAIKAVVSWVVGRVSCNYHLRPDRLITASFGLLLPGNVSQALCQGRWGPKTILGLRSKYCCQLWRLQFWEGCKERFRKLWMTLGWLVACYLECFLRVLFRVCSSVLSRGTQRSIADWAQGRKEEKETMKDEWVGER